MQRQTSELAAPNRRLGFAWTAAKWFLSLGINSQPAGVDRLGALVGQNRLRTAMVIVYR